MKSLTLTIIESDARILLESLIGRERALAEICENSTDQDEIADVGNDLVELRLLLDRLREQAVGTFGGGVLNFSREPL
jgi:hypothetical protein